MEISYTELITLVVIAITTTFVICKFFLFKIIADSNSTFPLKDLKTESEIELNYLKGKIDGAKEEELKFDEKIKSHLDASYLRGFSEGEKNEISKFNIVFTPFLIKYNNTIFDDHEAGYEMQLFYSGLPIGDASRRITEKKTEVNVEKALKLIDSVIDKVERIKAIADPHHIPITITHKNQTIKESANK